MPSRRAVLASLVASAVIPALAGPAAAVAPLPRSAIRPMIRPWGKFFIVDGWVLTARDLELLDLA